MSTNKQHISLVATSRLSATSKTRLGRGTSSSISGSPMIVTGKAHQNVQLTHPNDLDAPLRIAAKSKIDDYREQYANQNISFLPAITSTSTRESSKTPHPQLLLTTNPLNTGLAARIPHDNKPPVNHPNAPADLPCPNPSSHLLAKYAGLPVGKIPDGWPANLFEPPGRFPKPPGRPADLIKIPSGRYLLVSARGPVGILGAIFAGGFEWGLPWTRIRKHEEQSWSGCGESGSFAGQSQHQRLQHRSSPTDSVPSHSSPMPHVH